MADLRDTKHVAGRSGAESLIWITALSTETTHTGWTTDYQDNIDFRRDHTEDELLAQAVPIKP